MFREIVPLAQRGNCNRLYFGGGWPGAVIVRVEAGEIAYAEFWTRGRLVASWTAAPAGGGEARSENPIPAS